MNQILELFKMDLGISSNSRDTLFNAIIEATTKELEEKGISLDINDVSDIKLIADYAAWNYRKRQEGVGLSRNLDLRIKNRIVKERSKNVE